MISKFVNKIHAAVVLVHHLKQNLVFVEEMETNMAMWSRS